MSIGGNIRPPRWPVMASTRLVSEFDFASCSTVAFVPGDISSCSEKTIVKSVAHARCPYCGTARQPYTFTNCVNCGAHA